MALKLAVDRNEIVEKILKGHGYVGNDHPISKVHQYFATDIEQRTFDPDKAKWHIKQAGIDKLSVSLSASDAAFNGALDTVTLMSEHAKQAGIDIKIVREPNDGYWANVWKKKPWCVSYWDGRPTEGWMISSAYSCTAEANESNLKNETLDNLLKQALSVTDDAQRKQIYHHAQLLLRDECGSLIPMFANHIHGLNKKVQHPERVAGNWQLDGHRATERWWFES